MSERIGDVPDQRAKLGTYFTPLDAEAAIDAVGPVVVRARVDRHGAARTDGNAELRTPFDQNVGNAGGGMRAVGIAVRIAPGEIGWARDGQLPLHQGVVGLQIPIGDRPVCGHAILGVDAKV